MQRHDRVIGERDDIDEVQHNTIEALCETARITAQCVEVGAWLARLVLSF